MIVKTAYRRNGTFHSEQNRDIEYDNLYFECDTGDKEGCIFGTKTLTVKVSVKDFNKYWNQPVETLQNKDVVFAIVNNKLTGIYVIK